ncbi:MAG: hypothetical protein ACYCST_11390 [Acidimicrobiales bacterium]
MAETPSGTVVMLCGCSSVRSRTLAAGDAGKTCWTCGQAFRVKAEESLISPSTQAALLGLARSMLGIERSEVASMMTRIYGPLGDREERSENEIAGVWEVLLEMHQSEVAFGAEAI